MFNQKDESYWPLPPMEWKFVILFMKCTTSYEKHRKVEINIATFQKNMLQLNTIPGIYISLFFKAEKLMPLIYEMLRSCWKQELYTTQSYYQMSFAYNLMVFNRILQAGEGMYIIFVCIIFLHFFSNKSEFLILLNIL